MKIAIKNVVIASFVSLLFIDSAVSAIDLSGCIGESSEDYSGIHLDKGTVYCTSYRNDSKIVKVYGDTSADCQKAATLITNPDLCEKTSGADESEKANNLFSNEKEKGLMPLLIIITISLCLSVVVNIVLVIFLIKTTSNSRKGETKTPTSSIPMNDIY